LGAVAGAGAPFAPAVSLAAAAVLLLVVSTLVGAAGCLFAVFTAVGLIAFTAVAA